MKILSIIEGLVGYQRAGLEIIHAGCSGTLALRVPSIIPEVVMHIVVQAPPRRSRGKIGNHTVSPDFTQMVSDRNIPRQTIRLWILIADVRLLRMSAPLSSCLDHDSLSERTA